IVMRNHGSIFLEVGISVDVIEMVVGIDDEAHRFVSYTLERGFDLFRKRRELIIDNDDAVLTDREADIPTLALQHVNIAANLADLDLYFAEVIFAQFNSPQTI